VIVTELPPIKPPNISAPAADVGAHLSELQVTIIERRHDWHLAKVRELWRYRELLFVLAWRDIAVRYKQTVLGAAWAIIQPVTMMVIFSLTFGRVAEMDAGGIPYPLFAFAGLLPWFFFSNAITAASQSVIGNQSLVTKVYFPRLLIPLSSIGPFILDLLIGLVLLLIMMAWYGVMPGLNVLWIPLILFGLAAAALGVGALLAALTVAYRDFRYVVPYLVQLWMFATPSIYMNATQIVGPRGAAILPLNPAYGLIANFRSAFLGRPLDMQALTVSMSVAVFTLVLGYLYFRRVERSFADII
jgi:lipopolysaccharide transport system permease protein